MILTQAPELDSCVTNIGDMFSMCIQIGILGHAATVNKSLCVCEAVYKDMSAFEMVNMTSYVHLAPLRWLVGTNPANVSPIAVMTKDMYTTALCYAKRGPLFAYSNVAVIEAANYSSDSSFWMQFYKPMESITCHYGWRSVIFDSMVLSMGSSTGDDDNANLDTRKPSDEHDGFIDIYYTPKNRSAGRVRALVVGVPQRIETARTYELVDTILSAIDLDITILGGDWILR